MAEKGLITEKLENNIKKEIGIIKEISNLYDISKSSNSSEEKRMIDFQLESLKKNLQKLSLEVRESIEKISLVKQLSNYTGNNSNASPSNLKKQEKSPPFSQFESSEPLLPIKNQNQIVNSNIPNIQKQPEKKNEKLKLGALEKLALKRYGRKDKKIMKRKEKKPSQYVKISSKFFYNFSMSLIKKSYFRNLRRNIVKSNLEFIPAAYISVIFFSTMLSFIFGTIITLFFLFFNLSSLSPFIIRVEESIIERLMKVIWIFIGLPIITFLFSYFYPSLEKKSLESKIDSELPFATIHMSSISGSMMDPGKIFNIIVSTGEYPALKREFVKLQNEINIYGYDLVTALRNRAFNSPSKKLAELYNGLSTTITSGGDLPVFFEKRAQTLLFDHRLEMEKQAKSAETFMDIYISAVIAAPMILMLVLMMMSISGLGISLSPSMMSLVMILSISAINAFFIMFLHLKQPNT